MGNRRSARLAPSDDEDDGLPLPRPPRRSSAANSDEGKPSQRKRKKTKFFDEEEVEDTEESLGSRRKQRKVIELEEEEEAAAQQSGDEEDASPEDAKPIGDVIRASGKGRARRNHYESFEYDGIRYDLEDPVLLVPEEANQKPNVAIIKDISQTRTGGMMVTGQWFYRPEEAEKKSGGNWQSSDTRELFYSFHRDEVPAESVMHKCVVHFIPLNKKIPLRKQHPGFIVQRVYDTEQRRLFKLTDKDYEDNKQEEIDLLVQKTISCLGGLQDIEPEEPVPDQEQQLRNKRLLRKKSMTPLDVSRDDEASTRSGQSFKAETPGSCASTASEYYDILSRSKTLTGETQRDKWLERLPQSVQFMCTTADGSQGDGKGIEAAENGNEVKNINGASSFKWPDSVVPAVAALEKASHEALSSDFQKYNQKMRQLSFNLKNEMGKKEKKSSHPAGPSISILREKLNGKKLTDINPKSMLKLDHLKNLAIWATAEASVPSLGALFGHHLAATAESFGAPPDPSIFSCQRCESVLRPGYNCMVRIEKIKSKPKRRRKKPSLSNANSVVYRCHFCSHRNLKRGTPKGYMRELCPPKLKVPSTPDLAKPSHQNFAKAKVIAASKGDPLSKGVGIASQERTGKDPVVSSSTTPLTKLTMLDSKRRKRNRSGSKKVAESESISGPIDAQKAPAASSRRKRKSWTGLKDIVKRSEQDKCPKFTIDAISFHI